MLLLWGIIFLLVALVAKYFVDENKRRQQQLQATQSVSVSQALAQEIGTTVEIAGRADGELIQAPLSGVECVWWVKTATQYTVEDTDGLLTEMLETSPHTRYRQQHSELPSILSSPLLLVTDGVATATVAMDYAHRDKLLQTGGKFEGTGDSLLHEFVGSKLDKGKEGIEYREYAILAGQPLYVRGPLRNNQHISSFNETELMVSARDESSYETAVYRQGTWLKIGMMASGILGVALVAMHFLHG